MSRVRGAFASIAIAAVLFSTLTPTAASAAQPSAALDAPPVNQVPDTAYEPPNERPEAPEVAPSILPPEDSPLAERLAALRAARRAEITDVITHESELTVTPSDAAADVAMLSPQQADELFGRGPGIPPSPGETDNGASGDPSTPQDPESSPSPSPSPSPSASPSPTPTSSPTPPQVTPSPSVSAVALAAPRVSFSAAVFSGSASPVSRKASIPTGSACFPGDSPAYNAAIEVSGVVQTIMHNRAGAIGVAIRNTGSASWPDGTTLSYQLYDAAQNPVGGRGASTGIGALSSGGSKSLNAAVGPVSPGSWYLMWDINVPGIGWLTDRGVCPLSQLTVQNQRPSISLVTPRLIDTISTRNPYLTVTGSDVDQWPTPSQLRYEFRVCSNVELTANCSTSGSTASNSWRVPDNALQWASTYYWDASVSDGAASVDLREGTDPSSLRFSVVVPQPDPWRQVGNGIGLTNVHGLVLPYGVFVHTERDAQLNAPNLPLFFERTYSSGAAETEGALGKGWLTALDASAVRDPSNDNVTITYPDGRQEVFGQNGSTYVGATNLGMNNRLVRNGDGSFTVTQGSGEVVSFDTGGKISKIEYPGTGAWEFAYSGGQASTITQRPSGMQIRLDWQRVGTICSSSVRPTRPYVSSISVDRESGQPPSIWQYSYSCDRLSRVTDPLGGNTSYSGAGSSFSGSSPEGRAIPGYASLGGWQNVGTHYRQRTIVLTEPGSANRTITIMAPPESGSTDTYLLAYNQWGGLAVQHCEDRDIVNGAEDCLGYYDILQFDVDGRLRQQFDRASLSSQRSRYWYYGADGRLNSVSDENNNVVEFSYDAYGNLSSSRAFRDPWTQVTTSSFYRDLSPDPSKPLTRLAGIHVSPDSSGTHLGEFADMFHYDSVGHLIRREGPATPGAPGGEDASYAYTTGTEPALDGDGATISGKTLPAGMVRTQTTAAGTTTYAYDDRGNLTRTTAPTGLVTSRSYDLRGLLVRESTNGGDVRATDYAYDALGRLLSQRQPCVVNPVRQDETRLVIEFSYDRDGLLTKRAERAVSCATGADVLPQRATQYAYTSRGQLQQQTDPGGGVTSYVYAASDPTRVVSVTDPRGRVTSYLYSFGRLVRVVADVGARNSGRTEVLAEYSYDPAGRVAWEADALGRDTQYDYTGDDLAYRARRTTGSTSSGANVLVTMWTRSFDGAGRVISETVGGRTTTSTYDSEGRLYRSVLDPGGLNRSQTILRDAAGRVVETQLADPQRTERTTFQFGADNVPVARSVWLDSATALTTATARNARGEVTSIRDPRFAATTTSTPFDYTTRLYYDAAGRVKSATGPRIAADTPNNVGATDSTAFSGVVRSDRSPTRTVGRNAFGEMTDELNERDGLTTYEYDGAGSVTAKYLPTYRQPGGTLVQPVVRYEYNAAGDLVKKTDERGGVTDYEYDIAGNLVKETGPEVSWLVRPITTYTYDNANQLTTRTSPTGALKTYSYDRFGHVVAVTQRERRPTATDYYVTSYAYDQAGNVLSTMTPAGRVTRFVRNAAGEATAVWYQDRLQSDRFEYDVAGRVTRETDGAGRSVEHVFDLAGRETSTARVGSDGSRLTTTNEYDAAGNLVATTNPRGVKTTFTVNALNLRTSVTQPVTPTISITVEAGYDVSGNRVRTRNGAGVDTWTTYNVWNQPERVVEAATPVRADLVDRSWTYTYDVAGNQTMELKPGQVRVTRDFDALGQMTKEEGHHDRDADPKAATRTFAFDLDGRLTEASHPSGQLHYTWSDRGLLKGTRLDGGVAAEFGYNPDGLLAWRSGPNGQGFGYDPGGRLAGLSSPFGGVEFTYDYASGESTGYRTSNAVIVTSRDPHGRVSAVDATDRTTGASLQRTSYTYDANDNTVDKLVTGGLGGGGAYTYDLADRLALWQPRDGNGQLGITYPRFYGWNDSNAIAGQSMGVTDRRWTYDRRGLLSQFTEESDGGLTLTKSLSHDASGNVTSVNTVDGSFHDERKLEYDALGQLIKDGGAEYGYDAFGRVSSLNGNGAAFSYSGFSQEPITAPSSQLTTTDVIYRDPSGDPFVSSGEYGDRFLQIDAHRDVIGGLTGSGGSVQVTGKTQFEPFGTIHRGPRTDQTGADQLPAIGFQSDWTNYKTGASWQGARWYDAGLRTYLSRDDTTFPLQGPSSLNLYGYANANPLKYVDPTGRFPVIDDIFRNTQHFVDDVFRNAEQARASWWTSDREATWNRAVESLKRDFLGVTPEEVGERIGARVLSRWVPGLGWVLTAVDVLSAAATLANGLWGPTSPPGVWRAPGSGPSTAGGGVGAPGVSVAPVPPPPRPPDPTVHFERAGGTIASGVDAALSGVVSIPPDADGSTLRPCGLSGTVASCLARSVGVVAGCASASSPMRPCVPVEPVAGVPGSMGPALGVAQDAVSRPVAPSPQAGASGGGQGVVPPRGSAGGECEPGDQLPQDAAVDRRPPLAKPLNRPVSRSASQNQHVLDRIEELESQGAYDFLVNQQQVNIRRERVGINRPDLQYSLKDRRYYDEFERPGSRRGPGHVDRIMRNDPCGEASWMEVD